MAFSNRNQGPGASYAYLNLVKDSRFLMTQLAYLAREYFVAVFSGFGNAGAIGGRLYRLPYQFQEKAEVIFGTPLSEEFLHLLSMHAVHIRSLADALKRNDQTAIDYSVQQLYKNAGDISAHYAKVNPFWDETHWRTLLFNYIGMMIQDASALSARDFERDMDIFDRMLLSALLMGDYHADGFLQYILATGRDRAI